MPEVDLAVRNARIVSADGVSAGHLYVEDGRVAGVGGHDLSAAETVDAAGLVLLPGMVDVHIHLMDPAEPEREDWPTGTAAAAVAGVTTLVEHTHTRPVRTVGDLAAKRDYVRDRSVVDYGLAAHASTERIEDSVEVLAAGAAFLKVFTCETHGIPAVGTGRLHALMQSVPRGKGVFLVHAEDDELTAEAERRIKPTGRTDGAVIPEWRHPLAEQIAADTVGRLARATGATVAVAHCSHEEVVDILGRHRDRGADLHVETCPQYLLLLRDEIEEQGAFRKFTPPARAGSEDDLEQMWQRLRDARISYLASDHAPATRQQKTAGSIWEVPFGLPGIDTTLRLMLDAVARERLSWTRLVEVYSRNPARLYGFYPRKGCLEMGSDADFLLIDPDARYVLEDGMILSKAGWTPYAGRALRGQVVSTYLRGRKIAEGGRCLAPAGAGVFVPGMGAGHAST